MKYLVLAGNYVQFKEYLKIKGDWRELEGKTYKYIRENSVRDTVGCRSDEWEVLLCGTYRERSDCGHILWYLNSCGFKMFLVDYVEIVTVPYSIEK